MRVSQKVSLMKILLIAIYVVLSISGLVLVKLGGNPGSVALKGGEFSIGFNLISLIGLICYICSFLLFTRIVIMFDLSYIMPLCTGVVQTVTLIVSYLVFKEKISIYGIVGASLVIIGIMIMNIKIK